jgi:methylglutaconyl-CoA hydratase
MTFTSIAYSLEDRIVTIKLNRPPQRNALDDILVKELTDALIAANRNPQVRAIIITGAGDMFCAGMDLRYLSRISELGQQENLDDARELQKLFQVLHNSKKITIAMVNGAALGGGCGIVAACDFVFAAEHNTKIGTPEVKIGFIPAIILPYLIKRMGEGKAKEFTLSGAIMNSRAAQSAGLVTDVFDDNVLQVKTIEFTQALIHSTSPAAITLLKDLFTRHSEMSELDVTEYAVNLNALARKTEDFKKGIDAFLKKEDIHW